MMRSMQTFAASIVLAAATAVSASAQAPAKSTVESIAPVVAVDAYSKGHPKHKGPSTMQVRGAAKASRAATKEAATARAATAATPAAAPAAEAAKVPRIVPLPSPRFAKKGTPN